MEARSGGSQGAANKQPANSYQLQQPRISSYTVASNQVHT